MAPLSLLCAHWQGSLLGPEHVPRQSVPLARSYTGGLWFH